MSSKDVPITEATAKAGFDCTNWPRLRGLIDAVRVSQAPPTYPDRWFGPAAFKSDLYPDRWRPDLMRQSKGITQAYRNAGTAKSVPPFAESAPQLLRNLGPSHQGTQRRNDMIRTAAYRVPLAPVSRNKRGRETDYLAPQPKRAKTQPPSLAARVSFVQENVIDLTQDDENESISHFPSRHRPNRKGNGAKQRRANRYRNDGRVTHKETMGILAKIASKLRASAYALDVDQETLRRRWEADSRLQYQDVTDHLSELNTCFTTAEDGIKDALRVIENKLLV